MPATNTFDIGDRVRLTASFTDANGAPADPDTVTLQVKAPGVAIVSYVYTQDAEVSRSGVGEYYADIDIDSEGTWRYRWTGTGTIQAAEESSFYAAPSQFV